MKHLVRLSLMAALLLPGTVLPAQMMRQPAPVNMQFIGAHNTGLFDEGAAEIGAYDSATKKFFFVNAAAKSVVVLNWTNPLDNTTWAAETLNLSAHGTSANSVAVHDGKVAIAMEADSATNGKVVVFNTADLSTPLFVATVGNLPDMVTFTPDGSKILVANEGEPGDFYVADAEGSVSIVDATTGAVTNVGFTDFNVGGSRHSELPAGVRIYGPNASVAQDLEPEYIAVSNDNTKAYVSIQEANAVAVIDIAAARVDAIWALGYKDHNVAGNGLDASDRDGLNIANYPVKGMYQPDAIAYFEVGSDKFLITANEGDTRDYETFGEETRLSSSSYVLDAAKFPDGAALKSAIGRLTVSNKSGDTDNDGDFDEIHVPGTRSFTIWNATTGALVFDSGDQIEQKIAEYLPAFFNSGNDDNDSFDGRSDNKGPEPEAVEVVTINGTPHALVALERVGGVMIYDISIPAAPKFVSYENRRNFSIEIGDEPSAETLEMVGDLGPEDVVFIPAASSPNGHNLTAVMNEISGNVSLFAVTTSIEAARNLPINTVVTIEGIVTRAAGRILRMQDRSGYGIAVFQNSGAFRDSIEAGHIREGDILMVTGSVAEFNGLRQISGTLSFNVMSRENPMPEPFYVSIEDINTNGERWESLLVSVNGLQLTPSSLVPAVFEQSKSLYAKAGNPDDSVQVRIQGSSSNETRVIGENKPTGLFRFTGIYGQFDSSDPRDSGYQLLPVNISDFGPTNFKLAVFHNNDGESKLFGKDGFGGAGRFRTLLERERMEARNEMNASILLSSGDNFLAGAEFNFGLNQPADSLLFDSILLDLLNYDAISFGNHDFDFGPDVTARFVNGFRRHNTKFVNVNLDFRDEPALQALRASGRIANSHIINKSGERIGVVGAITPDLRNISSPGRTRILTNVAELVQAEVDALTEQGVNKIILISHLQSITADSTLATQLHGVDIMIAGGGSETLANPDAVLIPGEKAAKPYPWTLKNVRNQDVHLVTTSGDYSYLGRLKVDFDFQGNIVDILDGSNPIRVAGGANPDSVSIDQEVKALVLDKVQAGVAALTSNVIATTSVELDGRTASVRTKETNVGNLLTDALLWQASQLAPRFGKALPDVALQNGGGIRNNSVFAVGNLNEKNTFDIAAFANFVTIVENVSSAQLKSILERAYSSAPNSGGQFAQISGMRVEYNPSLRAQVQSGQTITTPGQRIINVVLNDGTVVVLGGNPVPGVTVNIATIDFLARGGDSYPYNGKEFTTLGVTYQRALFNYIRASKEEGGLAGAITAEQYPATPAAGEERIFVTTEVSNEEGAGTPKAFALGQNYPNPFNPATTVQFELPVASKVTLEVFDLLGRSVATLVNGLRPAGVHKISFDASKLSSGVYVYRLNAGSFVSVKKMTLVK